MHLLMCRNAFGNYFIKCLAEGQRFALRKQVGH